jgi:hypothetical protein
MALHRNAASLARGSLAGRQTEPAARAAPRQNWRAMIGDGKEGVSGIVATGTLAVSEGRIVWNGEGGVQARGPQNRTEAPRVKTR